MSDSSSVSGSRLDQSDSSSVSGSRLDQSDSSSVSGSRPDQSDRSLREPDLPRTAKERPEALRTGWTTGACSAAAAKAAATALAGEGLPATVTIPLPEPFEGRERVDFAVHRGEVDPGDPPAWAEAVVVKDAGDDPDVTHGAHLTVRLEPLGGSAEPGLAFAAGDGVGTATKPGLGLPVGEPAINGTPRAMIAAAVGEVVDVERCAWRCTISVPDGQAMAKKTTNRRLGIEGGISILGTTGVVRPFSTASWRASVEQQVDVLAAQGGTTLVLATGGRTEQAAMRLLPDLPDAAFVEVGDFTGAALRRAVAGGLAEVRFIGMAGKLAKLAAGVMMTHWTKSKVDPRLLACLTADAGGSDQLAEQVRGANSGRHAYELWAAEGLAGEAGARLCAQVADNLARFAADELAAQQAEGPAPPRAAAPRCEVALIDFDSLEIVAASPGWDGGMKKGWDGGMKKGWDGGMKKGWDGGNEEGWDGGNEEGWDGGNEEGWDGGNEEGWDGGNEEGWDGGRNPVWSPDRSAGVER